MIVYHYTTQEGFNEIRRTNKISPSNPWTTMDAAYGTGWYFTDLDPDKCDLMVTYYCWGRTSDSVLKRVEYYLEFDIDNRILLNTRTHVYMVENWDKEYIKYLGGYKNKGCNKKPCNTCETARKYRE